jgi:hypothetical protein
MTPKKLVTAIATILVACSGIVITVYMAKRGFGKAGPQSVRFVLTCLMSFWLIRGSSVARWIAISLMGLAGAMSLIAGLAVLSKSPCAIALLSLGSIYTACAVGLLTPLAKAHFTKNQCVEQPAEELSAAAARQPKP